MQTGFVVKTVVNDGADEANQYRRYRYRRHHNDRIDAGDVVAGALIIGGIFAVLSATSNKDRDRGYEMDDVASSEFDRAVDACVQQVERDQRIGSVDNVGRTTRGYSVSGTLYSGDAFACQVSGAGRVLDIDYGRGGVSYQAGNEVYGDPQYTDDLYARARAETYSAPAYAAPQGTAQPAYPGGPVPGEDYSELEADGGYASDEGYAAPY
ncbi:MAG: hypothetical protein GW855_06850 [Erythrobacter sp.]|nr:hypothetical protein [Erythrobacter sp.]NCQ63141.1 hypothetical protein [Alphaproteobacteria bacterium]